MAVSLLRDPLQPVLGSSIDWPSERRRASRPPTRIYADARQLPLDDGIADLIITSPPYWRKRKYGFEAELGQEGTAAEYADNLGRCFQEWARVTTSHASVFLNVGDTYDKQHLVGIPFLVERAASTYGWSLRNRIIWQKNGGIPEPSQRRLANRHEFILHFVKSKLYYYDVFAYSTLFWNGTAPGDVWNLQLDRKMQNHLAPFPEELVERALALGAPYSVCTQCGAPRRRIVEKTFELDESRPQAKRALQIARSAGLSEKHYRAIQATGISDAGKARRIQNGTGRNSAAVKALAAEAKAALGGYFREFTFGKRISTGWTDCGCSFSFRPGLVVDPFAGSGTTLDVATRWGVDAIGFDLAFEPITNA